MQWLKNLFSSDNLINKTADAIVRTGDALVYTDEEKAEMKAKFRNYHLESLKHFEPFKLAQRYIAVWYSFIFGTLIFYGLYLVHHDKGIEPLIKLVEAFNLGWISLAIVSWYFAGGVLPNLKNKS